MGTSAGKTATIREQPGDAQRQRDWSRIIKPVVSAATTPNRQCQCNGNSVTLAAARSVFIRRCGGIEPARRPMVHDDAPDASNPARTSTSPSTIQPRPPALTLSQKRVGTFCFWRNGFQRERATWEERRRRAPQAMQVMRTDTGPGPREQLEALGDLLGVPSARWCRSPGRRSRRGGHSERGDGAGGYGVVETGGRVGLRWRPRQWRRPVGEAPGSVRVNVSS